MLKILNHLKTRLRTTKDVAKLALTGLLFCIPFTASHACSVHDHGCIYHGFNATVNTSYPTTNTDTSVVLYSIGKTPNTGTPSNVDFDNKVWIPELTGDKVNGSYTTPTGAYILNNTPYGTTHPPADTYTPDDRYRLVYPSQYQITFNQNSAVAKHTGDFNGAENGNIPNATGCPNMPNAANCEAVVVTGNVPTGFYDQQVRIFNSTGNPNPAVDLQVGVYTTGKARLVTPSHIDNRNETADFQSISGTGATTPLYRYEIVNTGYDPHAGGVAWFDRNRTYTTGYGKPYIAGSHIYQNRFDTTDTTRTKIYKYGAGEQSLQARNFSTKHLYLGEVAPPPPPPALTKFTLPAWATTVLANTKQDVSNPESVRQAINALANPTGFISRQVYNLIPKPPPIVNVEPTIRVDSGNFAGSCKNYIECYQGTTQSIMPNGSIGLNYGNGIIYDPAKNQSLIQLPQSVDYRVPILNGSVSLSIGVLQVPLIYTSTAARVISSSDSLAEDNAAANYFDKKNDQFANWLSDVATSKTNGYYDRNAEESRLFQTVGNLVSLRPIVKFVTKSTGNVSLLTAERKVIQLPTDPHHMNQIQPRGWTEKSIDELVNGGAVHTSPSINLRNQKPATAYFRSDGHYVVIENETNDLIQMSDTNNPIGYGDGLWSPDKNILQPLVPNK